MLVSGGHSVIATTRSPGKLDELRAQGAEAVIMDGLDENAVRKTVESYRPEVIAHEMTALGSMRTLKNFDDEFTVTNQLRTKGTQYLLAAARASGAQKFVAQSYTGWPLERRGERLKTENDPFDPNLPSSMTKTLEAIRSLESQVMNASGLIGIVLRYGSLYGPGTGLAPGGPFLEPVRQRKFPLVGSGAGVWSFLHVDDAARATRLAIERGAPGIYNIVDDDPAEVSAWLPELAKVTNAKPPRHVPGWLARLAIGEAGVFMMTEQRGASNSKAKRMLGWRPIYASWRDGFRRGLATSAVREDLLKAG
jgi:nucleoside-diphosphate-sugar epimerase